MTAATHKSPVAAPNRCSLAVIGIPRIDVAKGNLPDNTRCDRSSMHAPRIVLPPPSAAERLIESHRVGIAGRFSLDAREPNLLVGLLRVQDDQAADLPGVQLPLRQRLAP